MGRSKGDVRNLVLVLGDQLDPASAAFQGFDPDHDVVWMAEVDEEASHVWSAKPRIAVFLAAMRHFRDALRERGLAVDYHEIGDSEQPTSFASRLRRSGRKLRPRKLLALEPGEWRVRQSLQETADELDIELEFRDDTHFYCTQADFEEHAEGRKALRLEYFYRERRRKLGHLMDGDQPVGGEWNYDSANRQSFGKEGPGEVPSPRSFSPDETTRQVIRAVDRRFADHPGTLDSFDWPVTPEQARQALDDFVAHRLARFGPYQDAMWTGLPYVYHSRLSNAINLHLLDPRAAVAAAETAFREGRVPLASAEGFIRQLIGWREFIRGIYWRFIPDYAARNAFGHDAPLPGFYWTGATDMACLRECIGQTLALGFAHHIQRLMVTGLFALILGVEPQEVHRWYLAVYVDAVEWVELPNVLGMSQFADGGLMATKPYAASGKYIQRMSNYCDACTYKPQARTGGDACPFTVFYWDFLLRHRERLSRNRRMALQVKNLERLDRAERRQVRKQADALRSRLVAGKER
ncbi:MAG: cryptochrome/photolyase family protein [Candidatus Brocadiia bacterium]